MQQPNMTTPYVIYIEWDGPYRLTQLPTLTDRKRDYGVYQIYGGHPVYGSNVLLYIGKADIQTFGKRIAQENWHFNRDTGALQVYVGRLAGEKTPTDRQWSREIDLAEKLLIYAHATAVNAKSIVSIPDEDLQDIHILIPGQASRFDARGIRSALDVKIQQYAGLRSLQQSRIMTPYPESPN